MTANGPQVAINPDGFDLGARASIAPELLLIRDGHD
jgi:hypothetical protein